MVDGTAVRTTTCKYCGSNAVVKFGTFKGVQRYFCKLCRRKFKADNNPFHMKVPNEYVIMALDRYYKGMPIKQIREHLKEVYNCYPSQSSIYPWIEKYSDLATIHFKDYHPNVGDTWIANSTIIGKDGQHKVCVYDIVDEKTGFLLASRLAIPPTTNEAQIVMKEAYRRAGKIPEVIIINRNYSYINGIKKLFGSDTVHFRIEPFLSVSNTELIERFKPQLENETKVTRPFRNLYNLLHFIDGWLVYYNFFRPNHSLGGKTPAEKSYINYDIKNWADFVCGQQKWGSSGLSGN